jgi:hypothetical protein
MSDFQAAALLNAAQSSCGLGAVRLICQLTMPTVAGLRTGNEAQFRLMLVVPTNGDAIADQLQFYSGENSFMAPTLTLFYSAPEASPSSSASSAPVSTPDATTPQETPPPESTTPTPSSSAPSATSSPNATPTKLAVSPSATRSAAPMMDAASKSSSGLSSGATAGVVIVVLLVVLAIAAALVIWYRKEKRRASQRNLNGSGADSVTGPINGGRSEYMDLRRLQEAGGPGGSPRVEGNAPSDGVGSVHAAGSGAPAQGHSQLWSAPSGMQDSVGGGVLLPTASPTASQRLAQSGHGVLLPGFDGRTVGDRDRSSHAVVPEHSHGRSDVRLHRDHRDRSHSKSGRLGGTGTGPGKERATQRGHSKSKHRGSSKHRHRDSAASGYDVAPMPVQPFDDAGADLGSASFTNDSPAMDSDLHFVAPEPVGPSRHRSSRSKSPGDGLKERRHHHRDDAGTERRRSKSRGREGVTGSGGDRDGGPAVTPALSAQVEGSSKGHGGESRRPRSSSHRDKAGQKRTLRTAGPDGDNPGYGTLNEVQEEINRERRKEKVRVHV